MTERKTLHTTIGLKTTTKSRLDKARAPGQCYDGFLSQLMDLWQEAYGNSPEGTVATKKK